MVAIYGTKHLLNYFIVPIVNIMLAKQKREAESDTKSHAAASYSVLKFILQ